MSALEIMARAIAATKYDKPWDALYAGQRSKAVKMAWAALKAIEQPTQAMLSAASLHAPDRQQAVAVWKAMVSEALGEPPA